MISWRLLRLKICLTIHFFANTLLSDDSSTTILMIQDILELKAEVCQNTRIANTLNKLYYNSHQLQMIGLLWHVVHIGEQSNEDQLIQKWTSTISTNKTAVLLLCFPCITNTCRVREQDFVKTVCRYSGSQLNISSKLRISLLITACVWNRFSNFKD